MYVLESVLYVAAAHFLKDNSNQYYGVEDKAEKFAFFKLSGLSFLQIFLVFVILLLTIYTVGPSVAIIETLYIPAAILGVSFLIKFLKSLKANRELEKKDNQESMKEWMFRSFLPLSLFFAIMLFGNSEIYLLAAFILIVLKGVIDLYYEWKDICDVKK